MGVSTLMVRVCVHLSTFLYDCHIRMHACVPSVYLYGSMLSHDNGWVCPCIGVSAMLVDTLFSEMQQQRLPAQVQSVYMTAFQIVNETIQDLVQSQQSDADAKQWSSKGQLTRSALFVFLGCVTV